MQFNNCHLTLDKNEIKECQSFPKRANSSTSRVDAILLDTSEMSNIIFNPDSSEAFYKVYPTIAVKLQECMRKVKEFRLGEEVEKEEKIESLVAIKFDFEGMKGKGLTIFGSEKLNSFDRIILDAINTLFVEGKNRYITLNMIYHVITGSDGKVITPKYAREINNSITKLMFTHYSY